MIPYIPEQGVQSPSTLSMKRFHKVHNPQTQSPDQMHHHQCCSPNTSISRHMVFQDSHMSTLVIETFQEMASVTSG
jgi:hypothetical protein